MKAEKKDSVDTTPDADDERDNRTDLNNHQQVTTVNNYNVLEEERDKDDQRGGPTP